MRSRTDLRVFVVAAALLVVWSCGGGNSEDHFKKGDDYAAQSMTREAIIEYRAGLQDAPKRGDIRLKLADLYIKTQDVRSALGEYIRAADLLPKDVDAQLKAGGMLLLTGQFEDAKTRARDVLAIEPNNANAQILLGNALAGLKDLDGAIAEYQEVLALDPTQDQAYQNIAIVQLARGKTEEAEAAFRKAIEVAPKSVQARMGMASLLWSTGRIPQAEQTLKEALDLEPTNLAANRALGTFYLASNRAAEAEPYFKRIAKTANTPAASIALADYYLIVKRYEDARTELRGLVSKPETYEDATLRLAAIDVAIGVRVEAQTKLHELLAKHPKNMAARLFSARLLMVDRKRDEALAQATSIVTEEPSSPVAGNAYTLIGAIYVTLDRPEDAIKSFGEVLKRDPRSPAALLALAKLHRIQGSLDKAASYVSEVLVISAKNPAARAERVRILLAQGDAAKAKTELASLQKEFPNAPPVLNLVAMQQLVDGQLQAARATYVKSAAISALDLEAVTGLVLIDLQSRRPKDAVAKIDLALKNLPPTGDLYVLAGTTYLGAGEPAKAEELLKKAIEIDPSRLKAYNLLAMIYVRQNRMDEAEESFREVAKRNPSSVAAPTMLGMLYDFQRRPADAEKEYKQALSLDPTSPVAANNLAWIYVASNRNLSEALELARTAQKRLPDEPNVLDTLGWIQYRQKEYTSAIRQFEASIKKSPENPAVHYHLGMAYAAYGESEKARQALTRALAFKVDFEGAAEARQTLQSIAQ